MHQKLLIFSALAFISLNINAQVLFSTTNFQTAINKGTRTSTGKQGRNYWQNRGNYDIRVNFDPASNSLSGDEEIEYFNNSPDTLKQFIIRLFPDYYKTGVLRSGFVEEKDIKEGVTVDQLVVGDENISTFNDPQKAFHKNTNLIVLPKTAMTPFSKINFKIKWHYQVNTGSQMRTGRVDTGSYFIAYFFPRIAVYDDLNGWDDWSYNGIQEFYNDFGNFNLQIDVPSNYVVWATGSRVKEEDNFGLPVLNKLNQAKNSDKVVAVIDSVDYANNAVFNTSNSGKWIFKAEDVSDMAFAISNHYLWYASSVITDSAINKKTLASAVFNQHHTDYFDVASQAWWSVNLMSYRFPKVAFPFPFITVFDGTDQMEYPMMVNDNPTSTHKDAVQLTTHEIFHSYFPFYMGINETQHAWMDEGWATIGESVISPLMGEPEDEGIYSKGRYERISGTGNDLPLITNTKLYQSAAYYSNSYGKGGLCYYVLQDMLGEELFFKGLHHYMDHWHGKHPVPYDFFYSINTGSGKNLNWFWQKWFFETVYPDLGISKVQQKNNLLDIVILNKGGLPLPVYLTITLENGKLIPFHCGADIWQKGVNVFVHHQKISGKIRSVKLGNEFVPDKFRTDNYLEIK